MKKGEGMRKILKVARLKMLMIENTARTRSPILYYLDSTQ